MQACFADLSRAELAHIRRCQFVAQAEGMAVVSSGVLASAAGAAPFAAPSGAHFWLVSSGLSGVVSVVWLAGGRLCCGCSRRRAGALTCSHAQTVRLWLLAAAGVRVPSLFSPVPPEPEPPTPPSSPSPSGSSAGVSAPAPAAPVTPEWRRYSVEHVQEAEGDFYYILRDGARLVCTLGREAGEPVRYRHEGRAETVIDILPRWLLEATPISPAGDSSPAPAAELAPVVAPAIQGVVCPACEQPAPAGVIQDWGICAACLDDLAAAEGQPRPRRCALLDCRELAIGETAYGAYCAKHLPHYQRMAAESEAWHRRRAAEAAALDGVVWTFGEDGEDEPVTLAEA